MPDAPHGHPRSTHKSRLAIDIIVDKLIDGEWVYQTGDNELYQALDELWLLLGKLHGVPTATGRSWGDYNHFSITWAGVA